MAFSMRSGTNWCHDFPKLARESGFRFNRNAGRVRVDWKRISSIDIDRVISDRDLSTVDDNVNVIADCCLESEYDVKILDPNFVKLFRLAQLAIEYLLYCKQYLDHSVAILKDELRFKIEENVKLNDIARNDRETIKEMKERLRDRNRCAETKLSDSHGEIHKCPQCPKTFISSVFMSAHLNRRHAASQNSSQLNSSSPIMDERYRAEAEKLHDEIKTLKERLNQTERLIRNESDTRTTIADGIVVANTGDKRVKCDDNNSREQDQSNVEEQHRLRYREEIKNFKDELFNEIRQNLNLADKFSTVKDDAVDCANETTKELIRQQENEIERLREQLYKRLTPDIEDIQVKLNNQEESWQSKIDDLEKRYRCDIETINEQLKNTRESADRMRMDYITKINYLERQSRDYRDKFMNLADLNAKTDTRLFDSETIDNVKIDSLPKSREIRVDLAKTNSTISEPAWARERPKDDFPENQSVTKDKHFVRDSALIGESNDETVNYDYHRDEDKKRIRSGTLKTVDDKSHDFTTNGLDNDRRSRTLGNYLKPRANETAIDRRRVENSFGNVTHDGRRGTRDKALENELSSSHSATESEASSSAVSGSVSGSSSSESESLSDSESPEVSEAVADPQTSNTMKNRKSRIEVQSNDRDEPQNFEPNIEKIGKKHTIDQLNSKLRDLGVDPEWQGIPKATLKQIMETVKHHRNLSCKKYGKLDKIRQDLVDQVIRRLSSNEKQIVSSINEESAESKLDQFLINAKAGRTWKSLASHSVESLLNNKKSSRRLSEIMEKPVRRIPGKTVNEKMANEPFSRRFVQSKSLGRQKNSVLEFDNDNRTNRGPVRVVENKSLNLRDSSRSTVKSAGDGTNDVKHSSRSHESLRSIQQSEGKTNSGRRRAVWEGIVDAPKTMVTSTPRRNDKFANATTFRTQKEEIDKDDDNDDDDDDEELFSKSPRNREINRSVMKSTTRDSAASLVKKKVVFDLDNTASQSPESPAMIIDGNHGNAEVNSVESDCEISSIVDETNDNDANGEDKQSGNIVLKTFQSEKIARISKQIEQQLNVSRRKPVGSIEAMFADRLESTNEDEKFVVVESSKLHSDTKTTNDKHTIDRPQAAPRGLRNAKSDAARNISNYRYGSKDSNLDQDIDELLEIE